MTKIMSSLTGLFFVAALAGCVSPSGFTVVKIEPREVLVASPEPLPVALDVTDRRTAIVMERTTIGHISMGGVVIQPGVRDLIANMVAAKIKEVFPPSAPTSAFLPGVVCEIQEFSVTTPATIVYWDVTTHIVITLSIGDQRRSVTGDAVDRTYVWPSESVIKQTTLTALRNLATATGPALNELRTTTAANIVRTGASPRSIDALSSSTTTVTLRKQGGTLVVPVMINSALRPRAKIT